MLSRLVRTCVLLAALTACARLVVTPPALPTLTPSPEAAVTLPPAASPTPQLVSPTPQPSPTIQIVVTPSQTRVPLPTLQLAPTAAPTAIPQPAAGSSAIQIFSPGPLSKIVSLVKAYGYSLPGYNDMGRIELFGEDGRLLAWQNLQLVTTVRWAYFYMELPFQTSAAGELGRLSVSTRDQYGRLTALNSVRLLLLPQGYSLLFPPGSLQERCVLDQPVRGQRTSGGMLSVTGEVRPYNSMPLSVELVARDGQVVGSQLVPVAPSADDRYIALRVDVPYSVSSLTDALLTISQSDDRIGGLMYVYSQSVLINP